MDPFRYCIHCQADCYADEVEHTAECPFTTGVFPITERDLTPPTWAPPACCRCDHEFVLGDSYHHIEVEDSVYEMVCAGCAAHAALQEAS